LFKLFIDNNVCQSLFFCIFANKKTYEYMPINNVSQNKKGSRTSTPIDNTYAHLQPQAVELERIVLGALLIDSDAYTVVSEILHPETFYEPKHQFIYEAIRSLNLDQRPVDFMTVTEELKKLGKLETVGGAAYIIELSSGVASSAHIEYHAKILAQKFLSRQLISFASVIETKAFDESIDVDDLMQEAEGSLFELSQKNMKQDYTQISPVLNQALDLLKKSSANSSGTTGIPTGYTRLDEITSGWQKSDLIILAGRPAMGKTSFALSLAKNMAVDNNIPVAFFSLEMNNVQLVNRLMSNTFEIAGSKILSGQLDDDEWSRLDKNVGRLSNAPIYLDDTPGLSIFELRTKARRLVREKKVKIIMIDYLQLMNANGMKFGNRQEEVSTISRSLKSLAKELDIPIIALSQLNRSSENRKEDNSKRPQLSDLRESGAIEQDADMVLFVHRPEYYRIFEDTEGNNLRGMAEIIIAKHRKGATDIVTLKFIGQFTRFDNPDSGFMQNDNHAGSEGLVNSKINSNIDLNDLSKYDSSLLADSPF
jgi:replicative DNA helicase